MTMEEVVTELWGGSSMVNRSTTHPIWRKRKWRRCAHNSEGEGIRLESHWEDGVSKDIEE